MKELEFMSEKESRENFREGFERQTKRKRTRLARTPLAAGVLPAICEKETRASRALNANVQTNQRQRLGVERFHLSPYFPGGYRASGVSSAMTPAFDASPQCYSLTGRLGAVARNKQGGF